MVYRVLASSRGGGVCSGRISLLGRARVFSARLRMAAVLCLLGSELAIGISIHGQVLSSTPAVAPPASSSQSLSSPRDSKRVVSHELVTQSSLAPPAIVIPRLSRTPALVDFLSMEPLGEVAPQMARVSGFVQRDPHDGAPVSQRTEAYLGYDQKNLYVVFVCFDQPGKVRAHQARREDVQDDDTVEIMLDTLR